MNLDYWPEEYDDELFYKCNHCGVSVYRVWEISLAVHYCYNCNKPMTLHVRKKSR
nr:hypothetical protein [uncultured Nitrososphaera sp.]